ncbi:hypothetical protein PVAND_010725 [Polypedilum vanderplanki]|uniref:Uncharacterized protein n=1 Tax=Polypedilum vanderplanki TaxID=319348 RepID=A0A9J6CGF9_POLVA|nr:hypothetical protein PVAND_010725 [Polypedilum vanderplanki]
MEGISSNSEDIRTQISMNCNNNDSEVTNKIINSSPETSPIRNNNQMDTTVELNGNKTDNQQFCLRWNNHQTSLLSTLPQLLDRSHLSDCTIVADGRKIHAHRLVLSGCSTFFSELFHTLESGMQQQSCHPIIVLPPNTSFTSLAALITFIYSGEVNVFEDQISKLLELAETLGIKGLTEINNEHMSGLKSRKQCDENQRVSTPSLNDDDSEKRSRSETPKNLPSTSPFDTSHLTPKLLTPPATFDAFFSRPPQFNFYSHPLLTQPLNFSPNRLPFPSMIPQSPILPPIPSQSPQFNKNSNGNCSIAQQDPRSFIEDLYKKEKMLQEKRMKPTNLKKIDKIAESLRFGANSTSPPSSSSPSSTKSFLEHFNQMSVKKESTNNFSMSPSALTSQFLNDKNNQKPVIENLLNFNASSDVNATKKTLAQGNLSTVGNNNNNSTTTNAPAKIPNSKLFAKCFICSKLLSNQYNLRVHLETHQNMRYACTVCSHVSRSKDALRKHISYRHPGTPSPCESENRRKRTKLASQIQQIQAQQMMKDQMAANSILFQSTTPGSSSANLPLNLETSTNAANQLALLQSFTSEMTIPTQATLYQHHQQQQQQISQQGVKNEINNNSDEQMASNNNGGGQ